MCLLIMLASPAVGQTVRRVSITGDRLSGFVLPIEPLEGNVTISAMRAWTWDVDDTKRLLLESDVEIRVGDHRFIANEAVVWMNRLPSAEGLINQFAFFFDKVSDPTGPAGVGMEGEQLLVTASSRGSVSLRVSALEQEAPRLSSVLRRGELRLAEHLKRLVADPPGLARHPQGDRAVEIEAFRPEVGGSVNESDLVLPAEIELPAVDDTLPPLITPRSVIGFTAGQVDLIPGEAENVILLRGGMVVQYGTDDRNEEFSALTLSAQRGVIFTRPGSVQELAGSSLESEDIYGVYLEGNVLIAADDGDYAARAPYVYYDFRTGQAAMFNAVLRTYARDTSIPVYARARELRQVAANQWVGKHMRVSTSEFFTPHIALGAETATITRRPAKADPLRRETYVVSENNTIRASDTPFLWWPTFAGTVRDIPLPQISIGGRENDGVQLETRWDLFQLLGIAKPAGTDTKLLVDAFTERGAAVGLDFKFDVAEGYGVVDLYFMYDEGTDKTSTGIEVEPDGTERGVALADHRLDLGQDWDIQTQIAWISDPTFITSRRENDFYTRREYETSLLLRNQVEGGSFTFLTQYSPNDFTSNTWLLASKAYSVDRVSEAV
ncbi:MAG: LPS-assembly protein LptD, partial [Planctomycetota bacterium]